MLTIMDVDATESEVSDYLLAHSTAADPLLRELAAETATAFPDVDGMRISHDEGVLLGMLVRLVGARRAVEVGVFTGYSSVCIARALPADGHLLACDVNGEWTAVARRYWARAGVADRIDLRLAPAAETLQALPRDPVIDFAFVDADKPSYPIYYEELVTRLRPGGVMMLDNVLLGGRVLDDADTSAAAATMRQVNDTVAADERVESVMLPVRDGISIVRRRTG
jgi:caffeoyl-CoA O-methyltransferase